MQRAFRDHLGREIKLRVPIKKIVSTVPSQTELLAFLGLEKELIGITKFCEFPPRLMKNKNIIGGTKNLNIEKILSLKPDLIVANQEENDKAQIEKLSEHCPVWVSNVSNLQDALNMINAIGQMTNRLEKAEDLGSRIQQLFSELVFPEKHSCVYLIWRKPYMTVGGDTFINEMLNNAGYRNVYSRLKRYPTVSEEELRATKASYVLLSSEPYPFAKKHIKEIQDICPESKVILVDGSLFSWYGSRLLIMPNYFKNLYNQISLFKG